MKKQLIISTTVIIAMIVLITMHIIAEDNHKDGATKRADKPDYIIRVSSENDMMNKAITDEKAMLERFKSSSVDNRKAEVDIKKCLQYSIENFDELKKGDRADIEVTKELSYALAFLYYAGIDSDSDNGYSHTAKERELWKTRIYQYVKMAHKYFISCSSLDQEEADYLSAKKQGKKIGQNIDREVSEFTKALAAVIAEAEKNS